MPVKDGMIDVPDRPGLGVELVAKAAKKYLMEGDADFSTKGSLLRGAA